MRRLTAARQPQENHRDTVASRQPQMLRHDLTYGFSGCELLQNQLYSDSVPGSVCLPIMTFVSDEMRREISDLLLYQPTI